MARSLMRLLCVLSAVALPVLAPPAGAQTGAAEPQTAQTPFAPVAVVNGAPITGFDVQQRMRLLEVLTDASGDPATLQRIALEQLIEDRLKLQEAGRLGIRTTDELMAAGLEQFAAARGTTVEALGQRLQRAGIAPLALRDLIEAEVLWLELVRTRFLSDIEPTQSEIDAEIGFLGQAPATAYRLQEIGVPAPEGGLAEAQALVQRLYAELSAGGDFTAAVRQYSRAPSAARDGELGWVDPARLPPEIAATLASLQPGQVSPPVPVGAGYSILKLLEVREGAAAAPAAVGPEVREQLRQRMVEQRVARLAEGLLQELRRDALIESR